MKTVALEDLVTDTILSFCENAAELGCGKNEKEVDMWFRYLSPEQQRKVSEKLLDIMERNVKVAKKESEKVCKEIHKETVKKIKAIEKAYKKTAKSKLVFREKK
jgi:hypothetical protein